MLLIDVVCKRLGARVFLDDGCFYRHIVPEHPEIGNKLRLVTEIVTQPPLNSKDEGVYGYEANPGKLFIQKRIPDFLPFNRSLRIGLRKNPDGVFEIRSFYPANGMPSKGVIPL